MNLYTHFNLKFWKKNKILFLKILENMFFEKASSFGPFLFLKKKKKNQ